MNKKGDISINVIIVAVIALVVLVVLVMIFTGRMGKFGIGVEKTGETELIAMKVRYGDCQPGNAAEQQFLADLKAAGEDEVLKDQYRSEFTRAIEDCKAQPTEAECALPCLWKK